MLPMLLLCYRVPRGKQGSVHWRNKTTSPQTNGQHRRACPAGQDSVGHLHLKEIWAVFSWVSWVSQRRSLVWEGVIEDAHVQEEKPPFNRGWMSNNHTCSQHHVTEQTKRTQSKWTHPRSLWTTLSRQIISLLTVSPTSSPSDLEIASEKRRNVFRNQPNSFVHNINTYYWSMN